MSEEKKEIPREELCTNVQGLSVDHESMLAFAAMSEKDFAVFAKPRFYTNQSEAIQTKWVSELYKIAVDYAAPAATEVALKVAPKK